HLWDGPGVYLHPAGRLPDDEVHATEVRLLRRAIEPPVAAAALAPRDRRAHDALADCQHERHVDGHVPARVEQARAGYSHLLGALAQGEDLLQPLLQELAGAGDAGLLLHRI